MSFSDHKITAFTHRIADLPDQPNLPADELKERFDSSPEELRTAHNAVCDDADRLEARVEGIIAETFGDTIDKSMLSTELAAELDAKAEAADLMAEATARESADTSLNTRVTALESEMPIKSEVYAGTYTGTGASATKTVSLGFTPKAVLVVAFQSKYEGEYNRTTVQLAVQGANAKIVSIVAGGFTVTSELNESSSAANPYRYLALR